MIRAPFTGGGRLCPSLKKFATSPLKAITRLTEVFGPQQPTSSPLQRLYVRMSAKKFRLLSDNPRALNPDSI